MRVQRYGVLLAALALSACSGETNGAEPTPPADTTVSPPVSSSATTSPTTSPADAFVAYAEGGDEPVPWAEQVSYYVHGERYARLTASAAQRRGNWLGCLPDATEYEGRGCPVSPLRTIRLAEPVIEDEEPTVVGCNKVRPPADVVYEDVSWVRPDPDKRDCFSDFVVAVYVDADGRITAVDLTLSGP